MMNQAFICDAVRTPFGRFGGTLATMRADDLAGSPASSSAMRATLRLSSPAWLAQPRITSSMREGAESA
jgi:acetyl-CoA acetyltransferase